MIPEFEISARTRKRLQRLIDIFVLIFVVLLITLLVNHDPRALVDMIGAHNGYLIAFLASFFGGLATVTFISVYPVIIALALGGLNPILLGLTGAIGLTFANLFFFYFGSKGRDLASTSKVYNRFCRIVQKAVEKLPAWVLQLSIWAYVGLTPFPNNLLTVSGGLLDLPAKKILIPLFIGNITLLILLAYFAQKGILLV